MNMTPFAALSKRNSKRDTTSDDTTHKCDSLILVPWLNIIQTLYIYLYLKGGFHFKFIPCISISTFTPNRMQFWEFKKSSYEGVKGTHTIFFWRLLSSYPAFVLMKCCFLTENLYIFIWKSQLSPKSPPMTCILTWIALCQFSIL